MIRAMCMLLISGALFTLTANGQNKKEIVPLKVGQKMPDLSLAEVGDIVYNTTTGNLRISDLKGKLIILDFWDTYCDACIRSFPFFEKLQREFKDSIKIILINARQDQHVISANLENMKSNPFPYELTQVVNAKLLGQLFPYRFSGNQIWIDGKGIIRLNGSSINLHAQKIREVLEGKPITYVKSGLPGLIGNNIASLNLLYDKAAKFIPLQQSSIFPVNEEVGLTMGSAKLIDSGSNTITLRYLNVSALDLYDYAFYDNIAKGWRNEIAVPYGVNHMNKFLIDVADTLRYTWAFSKHRDIDWRRSRYCYEQVLPATIPQAERSRYMFEDLNRYFGNLYGTEVKSEKVNRKCFVLVRTSGFKAEKIKSQEVKASRSIIEQNGRKIISFKGYTLKEILSGYSSSLFTIEKSAFLDETQFSEKAEMILPDPNEINSFEKLRTFLLPYGLDIILAERSLDMIVIREAKK